MVSILNVLLVPLTVILLADITVSISMDYPQTQCSQDGGLDLDLAGFERSTDFACTQIDEELNSQLELGIPHATAHTRLLDGQSNGPNNKVTSIGTVRDSLSDLVGAQDYTAGAESESDEEGIDMVFQATQTISNTSRPVYPGGSPNKTSDLHVNCDDSYNVPCENPKDPAIDVCTPENGKDKCDGDTWSDSECDSASEGIDLAILSTQPAAKEARTKCSDNLDNGDFFNAEEDLAPIPDSTREQRVMLTLSTYNSQSQIKPARSPVPQMASATNNSISPQFIDSDVPTQIDCAELVHLNRPVVNSVPVSDGETKRIQENSPTQSPVLFTRDLGSANGGNYTNTCSHTVFPSHLEIRIVAGKGAAMNETKNEKKHVAFAPEVDTSKSAEIFIPQSYQESESSGADWLEIGKEATSLSCKPKQTNRANEIDRTPIRKFCTTFNTRKSPTDKYQSNEIHNIFPVIPTTQEDDSPHLHHSFRRLKRRFGDGTSPVNRERYSIFSSFAMYLFISHLFHAVGSLTVLALIKSIR